jgi:hypothetical protein
MFSPDTAEKILECFCPALGSWADEMDSLPSARELAAFLSDAHNVDIESITAAIRTDEERARGNDRFGKRGDDFLSSRRACAPVLIWCLNSVNFVNRHSSRSNCWTATGRSPAPDSTSIHCIHRESRFRSDRNRLGRVLRGTKGIFSAESILRGLSTRLLDKVNKDYQRQG